MKRIIPIIALIIITSGCIGLEKPATQDYETINQTKNLTSTTNHSVGLEIINKSNTQYTIEISGYAPSTNYQIETNNISIKNKELHITSKLSKTQEIGGTAITKITSKIRIQGNNLENINNITLTMNNTMSENKTINKKLNNN
jgi:hypothetical protein